MSSHKLALLGGEPIRKKEYPLHTTVVDDAEEKAALRVLRGGHWSGFSARTGERMLGGEEVRAFEQRFADYFGTSSAVSFNSATSALHAAISACKIGPGDEVITSPFTMTATASSILMQNAIPIFADIEDHTYGLDPQSVESRINDRTRAILTVNLFGHPSRLSELKELCKKYNLILIEDNAQSPGAFYHGKPTGTIGEMGIFSLNYHKAIQTGEGGVLLTNNKQYAKHTQLVRNHGEAIVQDLEIDDITNLLGWNYRLTELQAAIGIPQLEKLEYFNSARQKLAERLTEGLMQFDFLRAPVIENDCTHVFYLFPIQFHQEKLGISREVFVKALKAEGISVSEGYVRPIYLEPLYQKKIAYGREGCPFSCSFYKGDVAYDLGICPTAEELFFETLMITNICRYPNEEKEVDEFLSAVQKIKDNIAELQKGEVLC